MNKTDVFLENTKIGFLYHEKDLNDSSTVFLVGNKGTKVSDLYIQVFKLLNKSFTVEATIGALENVQISYRNNETLKYEHHKLVPSYEILSLNGNVGYKPNKVAFPHLHVSLSDDNCEVKGGHLVNATISITLESKLTVFPFVLQRELDTDTQLDLIKS